MVQIQEDLGGMEAKFVKYMDYTAGERGALKKSIAEVGDKLREASKDRHKEDDD